MKRVNTFVSALGLLYLAASASADLSVVNTGMSVGDISSDGSKAVGLIYHYPIDYYTHIWTKTSGGAPFLPTSASSGHSSSTLRGSNDLSLIAIDSPNTSNWGNINCFTSNTAVPQYASDCSRVADTPHVWTQSSNVWTNIGWLPRSQVLNQTYTNGTFDVWVGGTRCDYTTGGLHDVSGNGRYVTASGWVADATARADGSAPSGICSPFHIGRYDMQTASWQQYGAIGDFARGDRINDDGSVIVGYDSGSTADPDGAGPITSWSGRRLAVWRNGIETILDPYGSNDQSPSSPNGLHIASGSSRGFAIEHFNQAPVSSNDSFTMLRNTLLEIPAPGILANDTDNSNGEVPLTLTAVSVSNPSSGQLLVNPDGSFQFLPANNFTGNVTFTYKAQDARGLQSSTATVTISVVNTTAPVATNDYWAIAKGGSLSTVPASDFGVLVNDGNLPHDGSESAVLVSGVSHGSLTFNTDGSFQYTPDPSFFGVDSFTYRAKNAANTLSANTATVYIRVVWDECGNRLVRWTWSGSAWNPTSLGKMPDQIVTFVDGNGNPYQALGTNVGFWPTAVSDDGNTIIGISLWNQQCGTFGAVRVGFIWKPTLNAGVPMKFDDYIKTFDSVATPIITPGVTVGYPQAMSADGTAFLAEVRSAGPSCLIPPGGDAILYINGTTGEPPRINYASGSLSSECLPSGFGFIMNAFVSGSFPMTYQWQAEDANNPGTWNDIFENPGCPSYNAQNFQYLGTSTTQLRIGTLSGSAAGNYRCRVTNAFGTAYTTPAAITPEIHAMNDTCSTAQTVADGSIPFNLCHSFVEEGVVVACAQTTSDLWYQYVPAASGTITIDTCHYGSIDNPADTTLTVFPDCSYFPTLACSSDVTGCGPSGRQSRIESLAVTSGVPILIRVAKQTSGTPPIQNGRTDPGEGVLTITPDAPLCSGDHDHNGLVDPDDLFAFLDDWFAQNGTCFSGCTANYVAPDQVDPDDLFAYLDIWFAQNGVCP